MTLPEGASAIPEGPLVWRLAMRDGVTLHVEEWGSRLSKKTPLLCLSGLTRNAWDFETLARRHAGERRVITFDFRGRGRSGHDPDPANYNPATYLQDIAQVCAALNLGGFVAVGTSMGGLLTCGLSVLMPALLKAAIINDIGPDYDEAGVDRIRGYVGRRYSVADWPEARAAIAATYPPDAYPRANDETWQKIAWTSFSRGDDGRLYNSWDPAIARSLEGTNGEFDLWALFGGLRGRPLLLVRGETSDLLSAGTADKMARVHGDMRLVTVAGTPHAPTLDEPECQEAINDFLKSLDERGRHA